MTIKYRGQVPVGTPLTLRGKLVGHITSCEDGVVTAEVDESVRALLESRPLAAPAGSELAPARSKAYGFSIGCDVAEKRPSAPLFYHGHDYDADAPTQDTLTIERAVKWYRAWVIKTTGELVAVEFDAFEQLAAHLGWGGTAVGDHVINPDIFVEYAKTNGLDMCFSALEAVAGRWAVEHEGRWSL